MARCPFARWDPIPGTTTGGPYVSGPFKIVHHTTEGSSYASAHSAYQGSNFPPHFTVDSTTVYQHIDTVQAARALRNPAGGVETNRDHAIQIEVVAFAGRPKNQATLALVAGLCRWIEQTHQVPQAWPNGFPLPPRNGRDPGGHNRDAVTWSRQGGHYGHSQVPENTHWDPGYTSAEVAIVTPGIVRQEVIADDVGERGAAEAILNLRPVDLPLAMRLGQRIPAISETAAVGAFSGNVSRNSPKLVKNLDPNIVFANEEGNEDDRYMTQRLKEKTDELAILVEREWPGVRLRVTDAWDEGGGHSATSRHYEGRAVDITTAPRDQSRLGRLGILAVKAGFDWVFYENDRHVHASVIRDEDGHEALGFALAESEGPVPLDDERRDVVSELRTHIERLEEQEGTIERVGRGLSGDEQRRLSKLRSSISRIEAALVLLGAAFRR